MKEIKAYKCEFCGKVYQRKHFCGMHENYCDKNPDNKPACWGCKYLTKERFEFDPCADDSGQYTTFYCEKTGNSLMPITSAKKGYYKDGIGGGAVAMPRTCEYFVRKTITVLTMKEIGSAWEKEELLLDNWGGPVLGSNFMYIPYEENKHIVVGSKSKDVREIFECDGTIREVIEGDLYRLLNS